MTLTRPTGRALPVLELAPAAAAIAPATPPEVSDPRLAEYRPETPTLPRFHVWTLGCQMNRSDSEEMAGRLLAAGCAEAPSMETADLVVINTCAIREAAEQKVIGRQGHLERLKAANPACASCSPAARCASRSATGSRAVPGGRSVPAAGRGARARRPARARSRRAPSGAQRGAPRRSAGATVGRATPAGDARRRGGAGAVAASPRSAPGCRSSTAATRPAPTASCRSAAARAEPAVRRDRRRGAGLAAAGYREVTLLGQNVNSYGHDLPAEPRFADVDTDRWAGRRLDLHGRPDLAALIRAIDGIRTADGVPAIPRLRFVTSHPWDLSDRLIAAMAECPSLCAHLHLPVQSGDDTVLRRMGRQYTIEHYLERLDRIRDAVPGIAISTDVIVGFCGESDAQFRSTLRLPRDRPLRAGLRGRLSNVRGPPRRGSPTTSRRT
jgi:tRNA-2-methylthio-N6-dimethylallyladenosine synthase